VAVAEGMVTVEAMKVVVEAPQYGSADHEEKLEVERSAESEVDGEQEFEESLGEHVVSGGHSHVGPIEWVFAIEEEAKDDNLQGNGG
jgi:Icc-related predicted phosphoesterase